MTGSPPIFTAMVYAPTPLSPMFRRQRKLASIAFYPVLQNHRFGSVLNIRDLALR
jgi:hypothetical protein